MGADPWEPTSSFDLRKPMTRIGAHLGRKPIFALAFLMSVIFIGADNVYSANLVEPTCSKPTSYSNVLVAADLLGSQPHWVANL